MKIKKDRPLVKLKEKGAWYGHEGIRHVSLIDIHFIDPIDKLAYNQACFYREKCSWDKQ